MTTSRDIPWSNDFETAVAAITTLGELSEYFVWSGTDTVAAIGVRLMLALDGDILRLVDGAGRVLSSSTPSDPFAACHETLRAHCGDSFRAFGYLSFELARFRYSCQRSGGRDLHLVIPRLVAEAHDGFLRLSGDEAALDAAVRVLGSTPSLARSEARIDRSDLETAVREGRDAYLSSVSAVVDAIRRQEVEKVILARRVQLTQRLDPLGTLSASRAVEAARRFAFRLGEVRGAGACPEILFVADADGNVVTNPLAGTRPRGDTPEQDAVLLRELLTDPKELAEHAQSIRLAYQELRTVVTPSSARVIDFMDVKRYRFTQHLSSRAAGTLAPGRTAWDALRAFFPGVTVTGVPKAEALRFVEQLELHPRRIYGGAVGWVDATGAMDWGIAIRSVFDYGECAVLNAGAGIVRDSDLEFEFDESVNKMRTIASRLVFLPS